MDDYYLANTNSEGVQPPSQLSVSTQTAALVNGRLQAVFDLSLSIAADSLSTVGIIYAAGPVDSTGALEQHTYVSISLSQPGCFAERFRGLEIMPVRTAKRGGLVCTCLPRTEAAMVPQPNIAFGI